MTIVHRVLLPVMLLHGGLTAQPIEHGKLLLLRHVLALADSRVTLSLESWTRSSRLLPLACGRHSCVVHALAARIHLIILVGLHPKTVWHALSVLWMVSVTHPTRFFISSWLHV